MARKATGSVRWQDGMAIARVTLRSGVRQSFSMPCCQTEQSATERAALLAQLARRLRHLGLEKAREAVAFVAESTAANLSERLAAAEELASHGLVGSLLSMLPRAQRAWVIEEAGSRRMEAHAFIAEVLDAHIAAKSLCGKGMTDSDVAAVASVIVAAREATLT